MAAMTLTFRSLSRPLCGLDAAVAHHPRSTIRSVTPVVRAVTVRSLATVIHNQENGILPSDTIPPNHSAKIGEFPIFKLPAKVTGSAADVRLGRQLVNAWKNDGVYQVAMSPQQSSLVKETLYQSQDFFKRPFHEKASHVDSQSFSGYIASGEELTDGIADYSETFTVTKDLPESDRRVQQKWPCHGPCPWPSNGFKSSISDLMSQLQDRGDTLLQLTALGLGLTDTRALTKLTEDGWHHARAIRFPQMDRVNGKGKPGRGIGSHTDYGLLVMTAQNDVGGLFVRPPFEDEQVKNWEKSAAGFNENDSRWTYAAPVPNVFTVLPGDMMQYLTKSNIRATPHKIGLNKRERYSFAYFHEPNFTSVIKPLEQYGGANANDPGIHYGTHFTNMFMRNYPERVTAKRMREEGRMAILDSLKDSSYMSTGATGRMIDLSQPTHTSTTLSL